MKTYLTLPYERSELPTVDPPDDVRTPEPLVEHFVERFTDPGDVVFDPFAGFGTTLVVAERRDRTAYGIEVDAERVELVRGRLGSPRPEDHVQHGDIRTTDLDNLPPADLCITSPPFMGQETGADPFENYGPESGTTYEAYLTDVKSTFEAVEQCMAPDSRVVVDVANLKSKGGVTTLAWDVGSVVADVFTFRGEVVVAWEGDETEEGEGVYGYGYDHSYCHVYDV